MIKDSGNQGLFAKWNPTQLMTAINCLTYGVMCLYYDRKTKKIYNCLLSIHEQYINILHVIIEGKASVLFQLQNIDNISDKDILIVKALKSLNFQHFFIVYTSVLDNYVLVMHSENEKNVIWEGLQYFIHEAKQFYSKISRFDPFKAEAMMLFMGADVDGSKLLDIDECEQNFKKLKINATKQQIYNNIVEINEDLYVRENLKRPKGFQMNQLTTVGFQYLLRYHAMKESLAPLFHSFCPIFKYKHKKFKKSIIDILKSHNKPLMSAIQLQQFIEKYMKKTLSEEQCDKIIRSFPVYDGEGQEIPEEEELLSFNHFCNFIFTIQNSLMEPAMTKIYHDMNRPLNQYYIYSSHNTYLVQTSINSDSHLSMYQICLKKGCRSVELDIQNIENEIVVKHKKGKSFIYLREVLKTIKILGFNINPFPILLYVENNCPRAMFPEVNKIFEEEIGPELVVFSQISKRKNLPSPLQLKNKILLMGYRQQTKNESEIETALEKKLSIIYAKPDLQRKGYNYWNFTEFDQKHVLKVETLEEKNLTDLARRGLVRSTPNEKKGKIENYDPMPMIRNGIQLIAINFQKQDIYQYILHSKFIENGGKSCGYLLKPHWIQGQCMESLYASDFQKPVLEIKTKVYAGQKLMLANTDHYNYWVQVFLIGTKIQQEKNKKYKTSTKSDGFYADFQLDCEFEVYCPDIACLVFNVTNEYGQILAARAMTIKTIREGLRTIQLLGPGMQLRENSYILVEYNVTDIRKKAQKISVFN